MYLFIFFNHIYNSSKHSSSKLSTLTDEYINQLNAFITGLKTDKSCYDKIINGLKLQKYPDRLLKLFEIFDIANAFANAINGIKIANN